MKFIPLWRYKVEEFESVTFFWFDLIVDKIDSFGLFVGFAADTCKFTNMSRSSTYEKS